MSVNSKKTAKKCTTSVVQSEMLGQRYAGPMLTAATFAGLPTSSKGNILAALVTGTEQYLDADKKFQKGFQETASNTKKTFDLIGTSLYSALKGHGYGNWSPELQANIVAVVHKTTKQQQIQKLKALRDLCYFDSTATLKFDVFYLLETKFKKQRVHYETKVLNEFLKRSPHNKLMKNVLSRVAKKRIRDKTGPWWIVNQNVQNKYGILAKPKSMIVRDDEQNRESTISTDIQLFDTEKLKRKFLEALQTEMTDLAGDTYTNWALMGQNFKKALKIAEDFVQNEVVNNFELAMEKSGLVLAGSYDKFESLQVFRSDFSNVFASTSADQFGLDHLNVDAQLFENSLKECVQGYEQFFKESEQIFLYERVWFSWKERESFPENTIDPTREEINASENFVPYVNVHRGKYRILHKFWYNLYLSVAMENDSMQNRVSTAITNFVVSDTVQKIPHTDESIYEMLTAENSEFEFKMSQMTPDADIMRKTMFLTHLNFLKRVMKTLYTKPYERDHEKDLYISQLYRKVCGCLAVIYWVRTGQLVRYQNYDSKFDNDPGKYNHLIRLFEENLMQLQIEFGAWEDQFKTEKGFADIISDVLQVSKTPLPLTDPADLAVTKTANINVPILWASYQRSRDTFDNSQLDGYLKSPNRHFYETILRTQQIFGASTSVVAGAIISYVGTNAALTTGKQLFLEHGKKLGQDSAAVQVTGKILNYAGENMPDFLQFVASSGLLAFSALICVCKGVAKSCMCCFRKDNTSVFFEINSASDDGLKAHNVLIKLVPKSRWNGTIVQNVWPDFKKEMNDFISKLDPNKNIHCRFDDDQKYFYFFDNDQISNLDREIRKRFHCAEIYCDKMQKDVLFIHNNEKKMTEDLMDKITEEILSQQPTTSPEAKTYQDIKTTNPFEDALQSISPEIRELLAQHRSGRPTL